MVKIDLGCGRRKPEGYVGIDMQNLPGVDIVRDVTVYGIPFATNEVDEVRAYDFLEHVPIGTQILLMVDIWRVLKPGGILDSFTPSTDGRGAFQDPTHLSFWNENSFWYYTKDDHRILYNIRAKFEPLDLHTTPKNEFGICHVVAKLRAVK